MTARQVIALIFQWHAQCRDRACRRAFACRGGETSQCFDQFWPRLGEGDKVGVRAILTALSQGATWPEAVAACDLALARWDAMEAKAAQTRSKEPSQQVAIPAIVRAPPDVRIRWL